MTIKEAIEELNEALRDLFEIVCKELKIEYILEWINKWLTK